MSFEPAYEDSIEGKLDKVTNFIEKEFDILTYYLGNKPNKEIPMRESLWQAVEIRLDTAPVGIAELQQSNPQLQIKKVERVGDTENKVMVFYEVPV